MDKRLIFVTVLVFVIFILIGIGIFSLRNGSDNSPGGNYEDNIFNNGSAIIENNISEKENNINITSSESTITREFSSLSISQGEEIEVTLYIHVANDEDYYFIEEYVPDGWTVTDAVRGGTNNPNRLSWYTFGSLISSPEDANIIYTLQAPSTPGTYAFEGIYMFEGFANTVTTKGQTTITVN